MVVTRRFKTGSRSGSGAGNQDRPVLKKDRVREIIKGEVIEIVRGQIPEMLGSIKSTMVEYFDERCAAITETAVVVATIAVMVAGGGASRASQYRDFGNMKPPTFNRV